MSPGRLSTIAKRTIAVTCSHKVSIPLSIHAYPSTLLTKILYFIDHRIHFDGRTTIQRRQRPLDAANYFYQNDTNKSMRKVDVSRYESRVGDVIQEDIPLKRDLPKSQDRKIAYSGLYKSSIPDVLADNTTICKPTTFRANTSGIDINASSIPDVFADTKTVYRPASVRRVGYGVPKSQIQDVIEDHTTIIRYANSMRRVGYERNNSTIGDIYLGRSAL